MDALVRAFTSNDDAVVVAADEGDVVAMVMAALVEVMVMLAMVAAMPATHLRVIRRHGERHVRLIPAFPSCLSCTQRLGRGPRGYKSILRGGSPRVNKPQPLFFYVKLSVHL